MSLLVDVMTHAIDEGYLDAAKRRAASASEPVSAVTRSRRATALMVAIVLAGAGGLFAMSAVSTHRGAAAAKRDKAQLVRQIDQRTAETEDMQRQLDALRGQVKAASDAALSASDKGSQLSAGLRQLELVTGADAVVGPGVEVQLDDAEDAKDPGAAATGTIYDSDVQAVVNALFASGAEAIAVNGERLTARTAIREAGAAILVDYRPLAPPYVIAAIGPPSLQQTFLSTQTAQLFQNWRQLYGLGFTVAGQSRLTLPSAANQTVHEARPLESP